MTSMPARPRCSCEVDLPPFASAEPMPVALIRRFNKKCRATLLKPGDSWSRGVAIRLCYESAMEGIVRAARELREAIEGKSPQRLEITTAPKTEITIRVKNDRKIFRDSAEQVERLFEDKLNTGLTQ